ncbi:hypothetical protein MRB53_002805 [Persea americana]|uniref:Uncharacterized protein n=1 Tax=Persea americana TaxID=3435 RepID=A0ACC2MVF1_PERAE|nr:hypothetical protein MRB53_002805 [Persea americana]
MGLLYGKEEIRISIWQQNQLAANSVNPSANVAAKSSCRNSFSPSSNRGRNSNNRGSGNTQRTGQRSGSRSATGPCQLYGRKNHMAASCCYRFDRQYNVDSTSAYLAASSLAPDQNRRCLVLFLVIVLPIKATNAFMSQPIAFTFQGMFFFNEGSFPFAKAATIPALPVPNATHWLLTPPPLFHLPAQQSPSSFIPPLEINPLQAQWSGPVTMRVPPSQPFTPSNCMRASPLVQSRVAHHIVDPHGFDANRPHTVVTNDSSQSEPSIEPCAASPSNTALDVPHGPSHQPLCDTLNPTAVMDSSTSTPIASSTACAPP